MKIILLLSTDVGLVVHTYKFYDHVVGIQKFITFRLYNRNEFFFGVFFLRFFFFFSLLRFQNNQKVTHNQQ